MANDIQGILDNKRIVNALKKHGGFTDKQLKQIFSWGRGPTIEPADLGPINEERPVLGLTGGVKGDPAHLAINIEMFEELEKAEGKDRDYWLFVISVTIPHETVHYGYIKNDLKTETPEEGYDFESDAYGEVVRMTNYKRILGK